MRTSIMSVSGNSGLWSKLLTLPLLSGGFPWLEFSAMERRESWSSAQIQQQIVWSKYKTIFWGVMVGHVLTVCPTYWKPNLFRRLRTCNAEFPAQWQQVCQCAQTPRAGTKMVFKRYRPKYFFSCGLREKQAFVKGLLCQVTTCHLIHSSSPHVYSYSASGTKLRSLKHHKGSTQIIR